MSYTERLRALGTKKLDFTPDENDVSWAVGCGQFYVDKKVPRFDVVERLTVYVLRFVAEGR